MIRESRDNIRAPGESFGTCCRDEGISDVEAAVGVGLLGHGITACIWALCVNLVQRGGSQYVQSNQEFRLYLTHRLVREVADPDYLDNGRGILACLASPGLESRELLQRCPRRLLPDSRADTVQHPVRSRAGATRLCSSMDSSLYSIMFLPVRLPSLCNGEEPAACINQSGPSLQRSLPQKNM